MTRTSTHSIHYGNDAIDFTLTFSDRRRLEIKVNPDMSVAVKAPSGKDLQDVLAHVRRRAPWIEKQRRYFEKFQPILPPKRFVSGETHAYLGRHYRLKVQKGKEESVKLIGQFLHVWTPDPKDTSGVQSLAHGWYRKHAQVIFDNKMRKCFEKVEKYGINFPRYQIRKLKTRWGSCGKSGMILLNLELIKAPVYCVEYVVMHELCHLVEPNHNDRFFRLLTRSMPDWQRRKDRLEAVEI